MKETKVSELTEILVDLFMQSKPILFIGSGVSIPVKSAIFCTLLVWQTADA